MLMKRLSLVWVLILLSCSKGPAIDIDVEIGSEQTENPIIKLNNLFKAGGSSGIYFRFEPYTCPPVPPDNSDTSLSHVGDLEFPVQSGLKINGGYTPSQATYSIPVGNLNKNVYYRVKMVAYDSSNTVIYKGDADCPISLGIPGANHATICFGEGDVTPVHICGGMTPFAQCPGILQGICP